MVNLLDRTAQAARQRLSSVIAAPAPRPVDNALWKLSRRGQVTALAEPPAGSGLRPVLGDYGLPLVGHLIDYIRFGTDYARERHQRFGPVSWMGAFGTKIVNISGPEATQVAFANKGKIFSQEGWVFLIDQFFRRGLMLLDFEEHLSHRRIMQEAFTRDRLTGYVDQFVPEIRRKVPAWGTGGRVRLYWALKRLTLDVATRVFMGLESGPEAERINQSFVATVRAATSMVRRPIPGTRWRAGVQGREYLEQYFASKLPAKRARGGDDLFAALCEVTTKEGERFSDEDIINHMIFLMMAAHDTATITSAATAYLLAKHPEWQERAREESRELGREPLDIHGLERLETLDMIIKEALRMCAPVPSLMRKTVRDTEVAGYYIPANTVVGISPVVNHYLPEYWTNPDTFDPLRFSEERREDKSHRFAWVPFGGGAHKCIGMHFGTFEVKAILHEMLLNYRWRVADGYQVRWDNTSLPVPVDGLPVQLLRC